MSFFLCTLCCSLFVILRLPVLALTDPLLPYPPLCPALPVVRQAAGRDAAGPRRAEHRVGELVELLQQRGVAEGLLGIAARLAGPGGEHPAVVQLDDRLGPALGREQQIGRASGRDSGGQYV